MSKTLFECFLVYYEHVFVYVFAVTTSFSMSLSVNFKEISNLDQVLSVISFVLSPEEAARAALWKRCSLKLRNIFRKLPVLESLFSKVVGLLTCSYIKKGFRHRCFLRKLRKFLRTAFLKNICEQLLLLVAC